MLGRITWVAIILAGAIPAAGYALNGLWPIALGAAALTGLWLVDYGRRWGKLSALAFPCFVVAAAAGVNLTWGAGWAPAGLVVALAAWDLDRFAGRLRVVDVTDETADLKRRHLVRLLLVSVLGLVLAWIALGIRIELSFALILLLGFLAVIGLSVAVRSLARESD